MELDLFDPAEADEDGEEWEEHDGGVADVREEDRELRDVQFSMINENKEEDQADESWDQHQQPKEESLEWWQDYKCF